MKLRLGGSLEEENIEEHLPANQATACTVRVPGLSANMLRQLVTLTRLSNTVFLLLGGSLHCKLVHDVSVWRLMRKLDSGVLLLLINFILII